jgi:hypothetical protein
LPYIKQDQKTELDKIELRNLGSSIDTPGQLNYAITKIIVSYFHRPSKRNYQAINDVVGTLEGAKLEFYRRLAAFYEDIKIVENGDVY